MRFLVAFLFVAACLPAWAQGVTATPDPEALQGRPVSSISALVEERFNDTLALLESEFRADYEAVERGLAALDRMAGEQNARLIVVAKEFTELRQRYSDRLKFAPTSAHAALVGHLAILYDLVFKEEGPEVCGRFAQDGSAALFELGLSEKYAEALDQQSVVYFKSVVLAIENPEPSAPVRPGDWDVVLRLMLEAGAPPSFAATVAAGDPADPDLCPALTALLLTMSLMDEPEGQRVRADFAQNVAGY